MKNALVVLLFLVCTASSVVAQDTNNDGYVSYLVPLVSDKTIVGDNGGVWKTELWVHSEKAARIRGCGGMLPQQCPPHRAGVTEQAFPGEMINFVDAVVYNIPTEVARNITLSSRLFEQSQGRQRLGVDVPVVREDRFFKGPVRFIGIPNSPNARVALRMYDPRRTVGLSLRVEIRTSDTDAPVGETIAPLDYSRFADVYGEPGIAVIFDLGASFPQLRDVARFDVRVSPVSSSAEFWSLVSVTDNATQEVLLVTADASGTESGGDAARKWRRTMQSTTPHNE